MKTATSVLLVIFLTVSSHIFAQRGTLAGPPVPVATASPAEIMLGIHGYIDDLSYQLIDLITYKKYDVTAVKILYNTIDGKGLPTVATGVVFLPRVATPTPVPVFSYLHGTLTKDDDVPSRDLQSLQSMIGWVMAMDGYLAVLPDYVGLGDGPGVHPFSHAASEASATIDMLKAVMIFLGASPDVNAIPDGNLYLSGYSQGAHAALATQRELEKNPVPGIYLRKTVAGSGAYSLSYIQKNFLFNNPTYPNPSFLPYLLLGYQEVYGNLYNSLDQVFVPPYNTTIPMLFDGSLDVEEIDAQLPATWQSMFVPRYLWNIRYRYFHPVNWALRDNDLINWKPQNDLHLYYCNCDELVAKENSWLAYLSFVLKGSRNVTCLPLGPFNHADCAPFVMMMAKIQFDCASGINPCGIDLSGLLSLMKSANLTDLTMFEDALNPQETLDPNELMQHKNLLTYLDEPEQNPESFSVFPNPAQDFAWMEFPGVQTDAQLILYDITGRMVKNEVISGNPVMINVRDLNSGLYKIVVNGDDCFEGKLMINH